MDRRGQHLSREERAVIFAEDLRGSSRRQIAGLLGGAPNTICREVAQGARAGGRGPALLPEARSARLSQAPDALQPEVQTRPGWCAIASCAAPRKWTRA